MPYAWTIYKFKPSASHQENKSVVASKFRKDKKRRDSGYYSSAIAPTRVKYRNAPTIQTETDKQQMYDATKSFKNKVIEICDQL